MKNYEVTIYISCDDDVTEGYVKNTFERFIRQKENFDIGDVSVHEDANEEKALT